MAQFAVHSSSVLVCKVLLEAAKYIDYFMASPEQKKVKRQWPRALLTNNRQAHATTVHLLKYLIPGEGCQCL